MKPTREDLAFEAGWSAGYLRALRRPYGTMKEGDAALTEDWAAYKRETAEPDRCGSCGRLIVQGALCSACRNSD